MSEEEWTIVGRDKKKTAKGFVKQGSNKATLHSKQKKRLFSSDEQEENVTLTELEINSLIEYIQKHASLFIQTTYYQYYSGIIHQLFGRERFSLLTMLGIGSFKKYYTPDFRNLATSSSFWQLIFGLKLRSLICESTSEIIDGMKASALCYDPYLLNDFDKSVYESLQISIVEEISNKKNRLLFFDEFIFPYLHRTEDEATSSTQKLLFFMPHCPYRLYCNILYSYWEKLDSIVIIGNSFRSYSLRRMNEATDGTDLVALLTPFIDEVPLSSLLIRSPQKSDADNDLSVNTQYDQVLQNAFSDLSILSFNTTNVRENAEFQLIQQQQKPSLELMIQANNKDVELF